MAKKNTQYECNYHNEDGDKCTEESVSCGYCEFHNPSLVIERMMEERNTKPRHTEKRTSAKKHGKVRSINASLADLDGRYGVTKFDPREQDEYDVEEYWPQTAEEWEQFEHHYAVDQDVPTTAYKSQPYDIGKQYGFSGTSVKKAPPKPKVEFPIGKYRKVGSADPSDKKGMFHIPHMQFFVLRTKEGYRAVWVSHCGTGYKGAPPTLALFNHHWSDAYDDFYDAEDEFFRGGETPWKIDERIKNVKDPKFLPPNTRKLATKEAWETLKLTGASDALIQKLKDWKKAGCPGWRTWDGKSFITNHGSAKGYTYNSGFQDDKPMDAADSAHIEKWMKKHNYKT